MKRLRPVPVVLAVLLCAAAASCSGQPAASPGPGATAPSKATSAAVARQLEGTLITTADLPAGLQQAPDSAGDTGPSTLAKAVHDDGLPNARAVLVRAGFLAGYQRLWRSSASAGATQVVDFIYQFNDPNGASSYSDRIAAALLLGDPSAQQFDVTDIPAAIGVAGSTSSPASGPALAKGTTITTFDVLFAKGPYEVEVHTEGPTATQALDDTLARTQYDRIGVST